MPPFHFIYKLTLRQRRSFFKSFFISIIKIVQIVLLEIRTSLL